jgi:hypothetical protein
MRDGGCGMRDQATEGTRIKHGWLLYSIRALSVAQVGALCPWWLITPWLPSICRTSGKYTWPKDVFLLASYCRPTRFLLPSYCRPTPILPCKTPRNQPKTANSKMQKNVGANIKKRHAKPQRRQEDGMTEICPTDAGHALTFLSIIFRSSLFAKTRCAGAPRLCVRMYRASAAAAGAMPESVPFCAVLCRAPRCAHFRWAAPFSRFMPGLPPVTLGASPARKEIQWRRRQFRHRRQAVRCG